MSSSILFSLNWSKAGELESDDLEYVLASLIKDMDAGKDELSLLPRRSESCA
jgi:hypothetical protein